MSAQDKAAAKAQRILDRAAEKAGGKKMPDGKWNMSKPVGKAEREAKRK